MPPMGGVTGAMKAADIWEKRKKDPRILKIR